MTKEETKEKKLKPCLFRPRGGIGCDEMGRKCLKCGWNPTVEKARKEKLYESKASNNATVSA